MRRIKQILLGILLPLLTVLARIGSWFTYNRVTVISIGLAVVFVLINYLGFFRNPVHPALPSDTAKLPSIKIERLYEIIRDQPRGITNVAIYVGMQDVVVYGPTPNLNGYLAQGVDTVDLVAKLDAAKIKHETRQPNMVSNMSVGLVLGTLLSCIFAGVMILGFVCRYQAKRHEELYCDTYDDSNPISRQLSMGAPRTKDMMGKPPGSPLTWDDVAGNPEGIDRLRRIERFIKFGAWFKICMARTPKGVLMVGPPGTGKTLLVKILAWVCDCNFLQVSGSDFEEQFVGVGASRWRKVVAQAVALWKKNGKVTIIFIDEVECIAKARGRREHTETTTALLTSIDGFATCPGLIFLAATNHPEILDPAFTRPGRFGERVNIDLPDMVARRAIFAIKLRDMRLSDDVDLDDLAAKTMGFSGAEIEQVCNEAATTMAERMLPEIDGRNLSEAQLKALPRIVTQQDLVKAIDFVRMGDELLSRMATQTPEERRSIEIHEAGHAFVNHKTDGPPPAVLSRMIRQKSLGVFIWQLDKDTYSYTDRQLLGRIKVYLAGRIAQEIILGIKDTAPSEDFRMASKLARQMAGTYGMTDFGFAAIALDENGMPTPGQLSDWLHRKFDQAWMKILADCQAEVRQLIDDGKSVIERLADAMELQENVPGAQVTRICVGDE